MLSALVEGCSAIIEGHRRDLVRLIHLGRATAHAHNDGRDEENDRDRCQNGKGDLLQRLREERDDGVRAVGQLRRTSKALCREVWTPEEVRLTVVMDIASSSFSQAAGRAVAELRKLPSSDAEAGVATGVAVAVGEALTTVTAK